MEHLERLAKDISAQGYAVRPLLEPEACADIVALYESDQTFRSRVVMARHGFGRGEYKYFAIIANPVGHFG